MPSLLPRHRGSILIVRGSEQSTPRSSCRPSRQRQRDEPGQQRREGRGWPGPEAAPVSAGAAGAWHRGGGGAVAVLRRGVVVVVVVVAAELVPVVGERAGAASAEPQPRAAVVGQPRGDVHGAGGVPALPHVRDALRGRPALPALPLPRPPRLPAPRRPQQQRQPGGRRRSQPRLRREEQEGLIIHSSTPPHGSLKNPQDFLFLFLDYYH
ncbi:hypothetical protein BDA96_04G179600 [Sorghum bicolor]|uniref:Uncharacterized protein n=1 Tax=Sorghum bicolor TaxID=4558 RepID=A0A921R4F2_SORBI|nr:hypothetical protein BDA96_04G179600 [Sorghum bicolor]